MIIDGLIVLFCVIAFFRGWRKGFIWAALSAVGFYFAILFSLKFAYQLSDFIYAKHFFEQSKYVLILSYIIIFFGILLIARFLSKFIEKTFDKIYLGWLNTIVGGVLYFAIGLFFISSILWLADAGKLISEKQKSESKLYNTMIYIAPQGISIATKIIPFFNDLHKEVNTFLEKRIP